jgi:hypothetical protein
MVPGRKIPHDHHAVSPLRLTEAPSASCLGGDMAAASFECAACIGALGTGIHCGDGSDHGPRLVAGAPRLGARISVARPHRAGQRRSGPCAPPRQGGELGTALFDGSPIRARASRHGRAVPNRSWTSCSWRFSFVWSGPLSPVRHIGPIKRPGRPSLNSRLHAGLDAASATERGTPSSQRSAYGTSPDPDCRQNGLSFEAD